MATTRLGPGGYPVAATTAVSPPPPPPPVVLSWWGPFDQPLARPRPQILGDSLGFVQTAGAVTVPQGWQNQKTDFPYPKARIDYPEAIVSLGTVTPQLPIVPFDQPIRVKQQYPPDEYLYLTTASLPPQIAGMAWHPQFDQPRFPTTVRIDRHTSSVEVFEPSSILSTLAGIPYVRPFEQPFFPTSVKATFQQHLFESLTPATLPPKISGNAWIPQLDQPFFPTSYKVYLQPPLGEVITPGSAPTLISGMAWWRPFDNPSLIKQPVADNQNVILAQSVPLYLSVAFDQPLRRPAVDSVPSGISVVGSIAVPFLGAQFDQPLRRANLDFAAAVFPSQPPAPVSTIAGMAWNVAFEQPQRAPNYAQFAPSLSISFSFTPFVQAGTLYVTECNRIIVDLSNHWYHAPATPSVADQSIPVGNVANVGAAFNTSTRFVLVNSSTTCSLAFGQTPIALPVYHRLPANETRIYGVHPGQTIAVIQNT